MGTLVVGKFPCSWCEGDTQKMVISAIATNIKGWNISICYCILIHLKTIFNALLNGCFINSVTEVGVMLVKGGGEEKPIRCHVIILNWKYTGHLLRIPSFMSIG